MRGAVVGIAVVVAVSAALIPLRDDISRTTPALTLVIGVAAAAGMIGGRAGAIVTAIAAAFNLAFIPPYWTLEIDVLEDLVALAVFTVVALAVGTLVARETRQGRAAEPHAAELESLHERFAAVTAERARLAQEATRLTVLEQVDIQRAALLRSVSHDLRTPLSMIRAVTSDLRAGAEYGPGVPPADPPHIFEPFWHAPASTTGGVGLSIGKAIVEGHGGTIAVEDGNTGARFVFTVPVHRG